MFLWNTQQAEIDEAPVASPAKRSVRRTAILQFAAVMALVALTLLPMLASGFYGDDEANSLATAKLLSMTGNTVLGIIASGTLLWMKAVGRFFPLGGYGAVLFWAVDGHALPYKVILMALVLLDAALLYVLVRRLSRSHGLATIAVLVFSVTLQFRYYHEPILSYAGLLPLITALVLAALVGFVDYLDCGRLRSLVLSFLAFASTLLIYEVALPMCVLFVALAAVYPHRRSFLETARASWMYLAVAGIAVGNVFLLRSIFHFQPSTSGQPGFYEPSLSPGPIVITVVKQVVAAVPLSFYASRLIAGLLGLTSRTLYDSPLAYLREHPFTTVLCAAAFFIVAALVLRTFFSGEKHTLPGAEPALVILGLGFLVLPNTLIALSVKHQLGVAWGQGYLPVFMSGIGVALLSTVGLDRLRRLRPVGRHRVGICVALAILIAVVGTVNFNNNRVTVEALNRGRYYPAQVVSRAAQAGLLDAVPDGAVLISNADTAWQVEAFYRLHANKKLGLVAVPAPAVLAGPAFGAVTPSSAESTSYVVKPAGPPVFYLHVENGARGSGYALLSRVESATVSAGKVTWSGTPLAIYRAWSKPPAYDWQQVRGWPERPSSYESPDTAAPVAAHAQALKSGAGWALEAVPSGWTVEEMTFSPTPARSWLDFAPPKWSRTR